MFLRGAESRFTAVYIDGVRIDSQATGGAPWESIPLAQIDRIEVLRGPAAAVYGSDAIGGVVQLFTRRGEGAASPYVGVGAGSRGLRRAEAGISGAAGDVRLFDRRRARRKRKGFNARPVPGANPDRDGHRSDSVNARLGWQLDARHRLDATFLQSDLDSGYDAFFHDPRNPVDDRNHYRLRAAGLSWTAQWTEAWRMRASVTESTAHYESEPSPYRTDTRLRGYLLQNEVRVGAHLFSAALERREDRLDNPSLDGFSAPIHDSRSQDALALGYGLHAGRAYACSSTCGTTGTASSAAGTPAAPPMALPSRRNGG